MGAILGGGSARDKGAFRAFSLRETPGRYAADHRTTYGGKMTERTLKRDELRGYVGPRLGASPWHEVTQEQVHMFADATGDHQWIHVDPQRAAAGPFGGPVAHGFLTLSLAPMLVAEVLEVADAAV